MVIAFIIRSIVAALFLCLNLGGGTNEKTLLLT